MYYGADSLHAKDSGITWTLSFPHCYERTDLRKKPKDLSNYVCLIKTNVHSEAN